MVLATGGQCKRNYSVGMSVCWGGKARWMAGRGGTTWGTTFVSATGDPRGKRGYGDLMSHEAVHMRQWKRLGPSFVVAYMAAEGISLIAYRRGACGN